MIDGPRAGTLAGNDRAVSEVIAFVLVFAIVIGSVALLYGVGFDAMAGYQSGEQLRNAERGMGALATGFADLQRSAGIDERAGELQLRDGTLHVREGGTELTIPIALSALGLGLLPSGVAYILYYRLIRDVGATMASYATFLIPIVGLFLGWLILDEAIHGRSVAGVALILTGLAIATTLHRTQPPPADLAQETPGEAPRESQQSVHTAGSNTSQR